MDTMFKDLDESELRQLAGIMKVVNVNYKNNEGETALHHAAKQKHSFSIIQLLVRAKADINTKDKNGNTPLHTALEHHSIDAAKTLISSGANIHIKNKSGDTPLHLALFFGYTEIANYLKAAGVKQ